MSYVLILSFLYKRFQQDARIRVFADDTLVDEIELQQDIVCQVIRGGTSSRSNKLQSEDKCNIAIFPNRLFTFHINEKYLTKSIKLEIHNPHSNYTNGFMSNYSYIDFRHISLIPVFFLERKNWKLLEKLSHKYPVSIYKDKNQLLNEPKFEDAKVSGNITGWTDDLFYHPRGGSFEIEIPLTKKHGLLHLRKLSPGIANVNWRFADLLNSFGQLNN